MLTDVNKMNNLIGGGSKTGEELQIALENDPTQDNEPQVSSRKAAGGTGIKDWRARLAQMR